MKLFDIERNSISKLAIFFCVLSIFSKKIGATSLFGIDFDFIGYTFCIVYFFYYLINNKLIINARVQLVLLLLLGVNLSMLLYADFDTPSFFKQYIPIVIIFLVFFDILSRTNPKEVFRIYVEFAYYSAIFGFIQLFFKLFKIGILSDKDIMRIDSVAFEPSHYAALISPAIIYSILFFKQFKYKTIILTLALVFTFSLTGITVLGVILLIAFNQAIYLLFLLPFAYLIYTNFILTNSEFTMRINGVVYYLKTGDFYDLYGTPLSFATNLEVAKTAISNNPLFGCGLGGHEKLYYNTIDKGMFFLDYQHGLNARSAHSLSIRVLSENGILGFIFYWYLILRNFFLKLTYEERAISLGCLSHFLSKTLKLGGYFDYGTPFFLMMLVVIFINAKKRTKQEFISIPKKQ